MTIQFELSTPLPVHYGVPLLAISCFVFSLTIYRYNCDLFADDKTMASIESDLDTILKNENDLIVDMGNVVCTLV